MSGVGVKGEGDYRGKDDPPTLVCVAIGWTVVSENGGSGG